MVIPAIWLNSDMVCRQCAVLKSVILRSLYIYIYGLLRLIRYVNNCVYFVFSFDLISISRIVPSHLPHCARKRVLTDNVDHEGAKDHHPTPATIGRCGQGFHFHFTVGVPTVRLLRFSACWWPVNHFVAFCGFCGLSFFLHPSSLHFPLHLMLSLSLPFWVILMAALMEKSSLTCEHVLLWNDWKEKVIDMNTSNLAWKVISKEASKNSYKNSIEIYPLRMRIHPLDSESRNSLCQGLGIKKTDSKQLAGRDCNCSTDCDKWLCATLWTACLSGHGGGGAEAVKLIFTRLQVQWLTLPSLSANRLDGAGGGRQGRNWC